MTDGFQFDEILSFEKFPENQVCLIIIHPERQPPHVALGFANKYFSLTVAGTESNIPLELKMKLFRLRKTPVLFVALKQAEKTTVTEITQLFQSFPPLKETASCLQPVVEFVRMNYSRFPELPMLAGLLAMLQTNQLIENAYQLNMDSLLNESGRFKLQPYDESVISRHILRLKNRKRQQGRQ
jgi:hypothetical protein